MKKTKQKAARKKKPASKLISDYDLFDTTAMIDPAKELQLRDLGVALPAQPPTEVVSIRLPTQLLNQIRSMGSKNDIPYQSLIKLFLSESVKSHRKDLL